MTKETSSGKYDVIVVGGGISGLICANYLARGGKKVLLLEQSHQAGGCMSGFWRQGFYFDGGDQSFESAGVFFPMLKELGVYDLHRWERADYRVKTNDYDFVVTNIGEAERVMCEAYPEETGLRSVFGEIQKVSEFMDWMGDPWHIKILDNPTPATIMKFLRLLPELKKWNTIQYKEEVVKAVKRDDIRHWLANTGYYGMNFMSFAGFWHMWVYDYWYPAEGIQALMNSLVQKIEDLGGEVRFKTMVKKILVRDGRADGVLTEDDETIHADTVVYTGDYRRLVFQVLGERYFEPEFVNLIRRSRVSEAIVSVYLGVNISHEELKEIMKTHHVIYMPSFDVIFPDRNSDIDVHSRMWMEVTSPSLANLELAPPGKSSIVLQTFSHAEWQNYWNNKSESTTRTKEYRELKKKVGMQMVERAEAVIPGLKDKIEYMDVGTPLSLIRFSLSSKGSTAGWTMDKEQTPYQGKWEMWKFSTPVKNLYAAGHYTFFPGGIPGAIGSGKIVASLVLKKPPLRQMELLARLFRAFKRTPVIGGFLR